MKSPKREPEPLPRGLSWAGFSLVAALGAAATVGALILGALAAIPILLALLAVSVRADLRATWFGAMTGVGATLLYVPGLGATDDPQDESLFVRAAIDFLGDRYAGIWLDKEFFNVAIVGPTQKDVVELRALVGDDHDLNVFEAKYSYKEIVQFADDAAVVLNEKGATFNMVAPDFSRGAVVVYGANVDPVTELRGIVPPDALVAVEADQQMGVSSARRSSNLVTDPEDEALLATMSWVPGEARESYPPYKAGRTLYFPSTNARCSAGFAFKMDADGAKQGSTAGHCALDSRWVSSGGAPSWPDTVGLTRLNTYIASNPAYGDSQLIGPSYAGDIQRKVFEDADTSRLVTDKFTNAELQPGVNVCKSGVGGATTCGTIRVPYPVSIQMVYEPPAGGCVSFITSCLSL